MPGDTQARTWGALLYQALSEPIGLLVRAPDRDRARQALYQARQQCMDPQLAQLQIRMSPWPEGDLVICKATVLAGPRPGQNIDEVI